MPEEPRARDVDVVQDPEERREVHARARVHVREQRPLEGRPRHVVQLHELVAHAPPAIRREVSCEAVPRVEKNDTCEAVPRVEKNDTRAPRGAPLEPQPPLRVVRLRAPDERGDRRVLRPVRGRLDLSVR